MVEPTMDLKRAYAALTAKNMLYSTLFDYYEGVAPIRYVSDRLNEVFKTSLARFTQNWAALVIDSQLNRIHLNEFTVAKNDAATGILNNAFVETELNLDADDVHKAALICGESFVFVWQKADNGVEAYYNDPRLCHIFYDEENPRIPSFAAKWWVGKDEKRYLNLYYPERIEYYVSTKKASSVYSAKGFQPAEVPAADNPHQQIPIFHYRPDRRTIKSALGNVIELQDAINKLFSDMMVAAEFGAFKQRWIITNADTTMLKNAPNEVWTIPPGDGIGQQTQLGEFSPTELSNYEGAMEKLALTIGAVTQTPKHYFMAQGGAPSGEALIAMEAPLNKQVLSIIDRFKPTWAQVGEFILKLKGTPVERNLIDPGFDAPETVQPKTEMEIINSGVNADIPLVTMLRRGGWTEKEIAAMQQDAAEPDAVKLEASELLKVLEALKDQPEPVQRLMLQAAGFDEAKIDEVITSLTVSQEQQTRSAVREFMDGLWNNNAGDQDDERQGERELEPEQAVPP